MAWSIPDTEIRDPDTVAVKVFYPEEGSIEVHQSRVCPCPPGWPAGCYWYGGSRKCAGKFPCWVEMLLEKADPEENTTNLPGEGDMCAEDCEPVREKDALPEAEDHPGS